MRSLGIVCLVAALTAACGSSAPSSECTGPVRRAVVPNFCLGGICDVIIN